MRINCKSFKPDETDQIDFSEVTGNFMQIEISESDNVSAVVISKEDATSIIKYIKEQFGL